MGATSASLLQRLAEHHSDAHSAQPGSNSDLIHLPMPSLCIRLPEDPAKNPLKFDWKGEHIHICSILMGDLYQGKSMSLFLDVGETLPGRYSAHPCLNFHRRPGLTVEQALANLAWVSIDEDSVAVPRALMTDCLRLCCTLCLLDQRSLGDFA